MKPFSPNLTPEPWPPVPAGWTFWPSLGMCIAAAVAMAAGILGAVW